MIKQQKPFPEVRKPLFCSYVKYDHLQKKKIKEKLELTNKHLKRQIIKRIHFRKARFQERECR